MLEASCLGKDLVADFFVAIFKKCCNGKIPTAKLNKALDKLHAQKSITENTQHPMVWIPNAGVFRESL